MATRSLWWNRLARLPWSAPWGVALVAAVVAFANLGGAGLWDEDESRNAACAAEMLARNDWVVPMFNGELRTAKPALLYWWQIASYQIFGINEFAARVPSALFSVLTCLAVWWIGRQLYSARVGLLAGIMLATSLMFTVAARAATPDGGLILGVTLTLALYVASCSGREPGSFGKSTVIPSTWWQMALVFAAMGWSMLAKGPVGVMLPSAIMGLFAALVRSRAAVELNAKQESRVDDSVDAAVAEITPEPSPARSAWNGLAQRTSQFLLAIGPVAWAFRPLFGLAVIALVAAPWYVWVHARTNGEWTQAFFWNENLNRFQQPMERHGGAIIYYLPAILIGFFPWSLFVVWAVVTAARQAWRGGALAKSQLFLLCWIGVWIGLFSLAGTKLPSYVLPAYPALALLTAALLDGWLTQPGLIPPRLLRASWLVLGAVGVTFAVGLPMLASRFFPSEGILGLLGVIPLLAAPAAWMAQSAGYRTRVMGIMIAGAISLSLGMFAWGAARVGQHQNSQRLLAVVERHVREYVQVTPRIGTYRHPASSVVYYARQKVEACPNAAAVAQLFADAEQAFVITPLERYQQELRDKLPPDVEILSREPLFLHNDGQTEIVLLGRVPRIAEKFQGLRR